MDEADAVVVAPVRLRLDVTWWRLCTRCLCVAWRPPVPAVLTPDEVETLLAAEALRVVPCCRLACPCP